MYPSDYGYATAGRTTPNRETCLNTSLYDWSESSVSDCKNNNWLYNSRNEQWTITPSSSYNHDVFGVNSSGSVRNYGATTMILNHGYVFRPSIYLNPNIGIEIGVGTSTSPFILKN